MDEEKILAAVELFQEDRTAAPDLADALRRFAEGAEVSDPFLGSAVFALGKRFDPGLKLFFIATLTRCYRSHPDAGYQCLIALDNLGEGIFAVGGSMLNREENIGLAEKYLKSQGAIDDGEPSGG